jgi:DnaJ-class molecular chaperone
MAARHFFELLRVHARSTEAEIRTARMELARLHHPDHGGDGALMATINYAASILLDPDLRRLYLAGFKASSACATCNRTGTLTRTAGWGRRAVFACPQCGGSGYMLRREATALVNENPAPSRARRKDRHGPA